MKRYTSIIMTLTLLALIIVGFLLYKNLEKSNKNLVSSTAAAPITDIKQSTSTEETTSSSAFGLMSKDTIKHGGVSGKLCFPSEAIPSLEVYLQNVDNKNILNIQTDLNQTKYEFQDVPVGTYIAFSYVKDLAENGGAYSAAVQCGLDVTCKDHSLIEFKVVEGETTKQIDICDWYGAKLPKVK